VRTFIEQKADVRAEIATLERENEKLYDKIDQNEIRIEELRQTLSEIGKEAA